MSISKSPDMTMDVLICTTRINSFCCMMVFYVHYCIAGNFRGAQVLQIR